MQINDITGHYAKNSTVSKGRSITTGVTGLYHLLNDARAVDLDVSLSAVESNHQIIRVVGKALQVHTNHRM